MCRKSRGHPFTLTGYSANLDISLRAARNMMAPFHNGLEPGATVSPISAPRLLKANADSSYTVWFGPKAPAGQEGNWVQTWPGKGWNVLLRLYGPLEPRFDKTWKPGDIELIE